MPFNTWPDGSATSAQHSSSLPSTCSGWPLGGAGAVAPGLRSAVPGCRLDAPNRRRTAAACWRKRGSLEEHRSGGTSADTRLLSSGLRFAGPCRSKPAHAGIRHDGKERLCRETPRPGRPEFWVRLPRPADALRRRRSQCVDRLSSPDRADLESLSGRGSSALPRFPEPLAVYLGRGASQGKQCPPPR